MKLWITSISMTTFVAKISSGSFTTCGSEMKKSNDVITCDLTIFFVSGSLVVFKHRTLLSSPLSNTLLDLVNTQYSMSLIMMEGLLLNPSVV
ncbi:hypothetical protein WICPIJ_004976 [Wickerhamomyces pijperi]|uniref:Uncharacterized protein n=1 Tax=Wickerhamomyces pijperi TaxID=599730 RepID=A0A9P8Q4Q7_WICPI|nr:hypothetical protein WICPIJ_004976 [Wickerhamomyces pijperi]